MLVQVQSSHRHGTCGSPSSSTFMKPSLAQGTDRDQARRSVGRSRHRAPERCQQAWGPDAGLASAWRVGARDSLF